MDSPEQLELFELLSCVTDTIDMVSSAVYNHHYQVAYAARELALMADLPQEDIYRITCAGLIHDVGALSVPERLKALDFDDYNQKPHAESGYWLLQGTDALADIAEIIRYHHHHFAVSRDNPEIPFGSCIVHLADRIAILAAGRGDGVLLERNGIISQINDQSGKMFAPELVDVFNELAGRESFWLDLTSRNMRSLISGKIDSPDQILNFEQIKNIGTVFEKIIDFRSRHTATHTSGVSGAVKRLAAKAGFAGEELDLIAIAGHFHDLGKLAVPTEILEKPGKLTTSEFALMKTHTYYTSRAISYLPGWEQVNRWASYHHECLDGNGYPFKVDRRDLDTGCRLMAVADIFTALTEERPYKDPLDKNTTMSILQNMAESSSIDPEVVALLHENYEEIENVCIQARTSALEEYNRFESHLEN